LDKIPLIYKCNSPNASALHRYHWSIIYMSDDAMIARSTLRSTHQFCANYGLPQKNSFLIPTDKITDWPTLHQIDQNWQNTHGAARCGTMGHFEIEYLSTHFIARAEHRGRPYAFVTFQKGGNEWRLDVMRHNQKCPTAPCTLLSTAQLQQQESWESNG